MLNIEEIYNKKHTESPKSEKSERAELLKIFIDTIKDKSGKPYRPSFVGMKLAHLNLKDLYYLKSVCEKSDNFGRTFWGGLKIKNPRIL